MKIFLFFIISSFLYIIKTKNISYWKGDKKKRSQIHKKICLTVLRRHHFLFSSHRDTLTLMATAIGSGRKPHKTNHHLHDRCQWLHWVSPLREAHEWNSSQGFCFATTAKPNTFLKRDTLPCAGRIQFYCLNIDSRLESLIKIADLVSLFIL